jgi:hypothetical protein
VWSLARYSTLLLATILAGPALWHAFVVRDMDVDTAIIRFLIAVLLSAVMLGVLRSVTRDYRNRPPAAPSPDEESPKEPADPDAPRRRTGEVPDDTPVDRS